MILFTYSSNENQNFEILQDFLFLKFPNEYVKECCDFYSCGRKTNEISLLFLENEIRVFYSLPRKDEFDTILLNSSIFSSMEISDELKNSTILFKI